MTKEMNHRIFSENMKLADLVIADYRLLYVLPRFGIDLGFADATIKQVCETNGISTTLFLTVCNVYAFEEYLPTEETLNKVSTEKLIEYLENSHIDYRQNRLPILMDQIKEVVVANCSQRHREVLSKFCTKYEQEVLAHFADEETVVFPYVKQLISRTHDLKYTIKDYEGNHSNIEQALTDLKSIMIKYMRDECTIQKCRNVLIGIFLFEDDLNKHTLLEDKVLVPMVERIERKR